MSARAAVLLAAAALLLAWAAAIVRLRRTTPTGSRPTGFAEWHHAYWGAACCLAPAGWGWVAWGLWGVGLLLLADDAWQHHRQVTRPDYLSPIHRLYVRAALWLIARSRLARRIARLLGEA